MTNHDEGGTEVPALSWGRAYDAGYSAGRADAIGSGTTGLLEEIGRYRSALALIGRKGKPLPGAAAKAIARRALDRTMYEHVPPASGEGVAPWDLGDRRSHKAG